MVSIPGIPSVPGSGSGATQKDVAEKLFSTLGSSPRPAVIDYEFDETQESFRTELSGRVLTNWATKMTHLLDSVGVAEGSDMTVDLPVTWLSCGLVLGGVWSEAELVFDTDADTEFVLTDRLDAWESSTAEILAIGMGEDSDPTVTNVDADIAAQPDQPFLPDPRNVLDAYPAPEGSSPGVVRFPEGLAIATGTGGTNISEARMSREILAQILATLSEMKPVILIRQSPTSLAGHNWYEADAVAHILQTEGFSIPV